MVLYTNNRPILQKFYSEESFLFFKAFTKNEYLDFLSKSSISHYMFEERLDFPYNIKKVNGVNVTGYYLMEIFPNFVYSENELEHKSYFYGFGCRRYMIEESYIKQGPKGLCLQTRQHKAIELLIGSELVVCFEKELDIIK
jgi:hypothetical protein